MGRTVLLVDDDANLLHAVSRALRKEPYTIKIATSASEALQLLEQCPVDVVVSDERMPGMTGTTFLARVQEQYPDTIRIMMTGETALEVAVQAINEGQVYRFFTKPCNPIELATGIRQGLMHRALLLESRRLLHTVRRQSAAMEELEAAVRGITHVARDDSGAIVLSDVPRDLEGLLAEVETELSAAEERLREREDEIRRRGEEMIAERQRRPTQGSAQR
jgi:two-component system, probable response regulator PhcQ